MASLFKKQVKVFDQATGQYRTEKSKKWYGRWRDADGTEKRVPLATDKRVAQMILSDILAKVEREKAGIVDVVAEDMQRPLTDHLNDFEEHLHAKKDTEKHVQLTMTRIRNVCQFCHWVDLRSLKVCDVERFLTHFWNVEHCAIETGNHYIRALKNFGTWLYVNDRIVRDPFLKLKVLNSSVDERHCRRALSMDEFQMLIHAAASGPSVQGICGRDRVILYYLAAWTGFRRKELGSLTTAHLVLDGETPFIQIQASYSKRKRNDIQYLHPDLVDILKEWLDKRKPKPDEILFPISKENGGKDRRTAHMIAYDLNSARHFWIEEADTEEEKHKREQSDFLMYKDSHGKFADFHGLRHTFITNLSLNGVDPKTAQTLARHSSMELTMKTYTHINAKVQQDAINALPSPKQE
ncbi:MAG: site-specific integrase [Planctomycetia bacterium]|nr:site-specific integrase [Planctomycetia bacterium]